MRAPPLKRDVTWRASKQQHEVVWINGRWVRREHIEAAIIKDWQEHQDYELEGVLPEASPKDDLLNLEKNPPLYPMVIPASLANDPFRAAAETIKHEPDHFIDALRELEGKPTHVDAPSMTVEELLFELEKEFPATMGVAPAILTFDDVERISERADKYETMAAAIEADPNWLADPEIEDDDLIAALRLAAKALRNGVQP